MQMFWTLFAILGLAASVFLGNIQDWRDTETQGEICLLYTSPSPRDQRGSRMPSSA